MYWKNMNYVVYENIEHRVYMRRSYNYPFIK